MAVVAFPDAVVQLLEHMKRAKKLGFQSVWEDIKKNRVKFVRWQQFHWVLSPQLCHFVHDAPVMYRGFAESTEDPVSSVKEEPIDIDEVW